MPKMFGFSRRRMKLGRLKVQLGDPLQAPRSPLRVTKRLDQSNEEKEVLPSGSGRDEVNRHCSSGAFGSPENWTALSTEGNKPTPRSHHAAAVVGSKMVVVGGDSGHKLLDDTMILSLDRLTWAAAVPRVYLSANGISLKIPSCKGHSLVSWGKSVLLIGGKTDPVSERVSVWSFDTETEHWSRIEVKGDIPVARSGHTVTRAGSVLILFGGEDVKGKKLNDLHMFDLKSFTWLPLHYKGTKPSPRTNHVATLYDDKTLFVFGGQSKSKFLNDIYSLDFETMVWSRIKIRGHHPSPRSGCCGALCGTKWYITGGGSKRKRHAETLIFDVISFEWTVSIASPSTSVTTSRGFTMLPVHHKDKTFLVAFGGYKKEASNQVEILFLTKNEHSMSWRSAPDTVLLSYEDYPSNTKELGAHLKAGASPTSNEPMARHSLASTIEQQAPGRKSLSEDPNSFSTSMPLSKQLHSERNHSLAVKMQKSLEDEKHSSNDHLDTSSSQAIEQRSKRQEVAGQMDIAGILASTDEIPFEPESSILSQKQGDHNPNSDSPHVLPTETEGRSVLTNPNNMYQLYETRIATLTRKNVLLEEQLKAAVSSREAVEKNLSSAIRSRQDVERKLADAVKEVDLLKEKLTGMELAQEEANSLSNIVHSDNVRLEHDVAFLKAILDDTQKELHSTRGVIAGERARAFQLQVEVFHLKQRLQSADNRAPTPRKPYNV